MPRVALSTSENKRRKRERDRERQQKNCGPPKIQLTQEEQRDRKRQRDREKWRQNRQRTHQSQDAASASTQLVVETVMENDEEIPDTNGFLQAESQEIHDERMSIVANVIRNLNAEFAANKNPNVDRLPTPSMSLTQIQDEIQTPQQMTQPRLPEVTIEEAEERQERVRGIRQQYMV